MSNLPQTPGSKPWLSWIQRVAFPLGMMSLGALTVLVAPTGCSDENPLGSVGTGSGGSGGGTCSDEDADGFGEGCLSGRDCDDGDPGSTNECYYCDMPGREGCPCPTDAEGERAACGKVEAVINDQVACGFGESVCSNGEWGECIINNTSLVEKPSSGAMNLGSAQSCVGNVCDPYCKEFNDDPTGVDPGPGGVVIGPGGVTVPGAACPAPPAEVCQVFGTCSHSVCTSGGALSVGCDADTDVVGWQTVFADEFANNTAGWLMDGPWEIRGANQSSCATSYGSDPGTDHTPGGNNGLAGLNVGGCIYDFELAWWGSRYLISPPIDLTPHTSANLTFYQHLHARWPIDHEVNVYTETGGYLGRVYAAPSSHNSSAWEKITVSLNGYVGQRIRLGFRTFTASSSSSYWDRRAASWTIDDLEVKGYNSTVITHANLGSCIQSICNDRPSCCSGSWDQACADLAGCYCTVNDPDLSSCANESANAQLAPVDLYVMLDRSCSMYGTPWNTVTGALTTFINDPYSNGIGMGIEYFGNGGSSSYCSGSNYANPNVGIALLPGNAASLTSSISGTSVSGGTPTKPAIDGAISRAVTNQANTGRKTVVVLATDGLPTDCSSSVSNVRTSIQNGFTGSSQINTFVIGVGTGAGVTNMNSWASAGGTNQAIVVAANDAQGFIDALTAIRNQGVSCTFDIPAPASGTIDPAQVNVVYTDNTGASTAFLKVTDASACGANGGWYFDNNTNPTKVTLCPTTCNSVQADPYAQIEVVFGCLSQQAPGNPGYSSGYFDRTYDATFCGAGTKPVWGLWSWSATTPSDSRVEFQVAAASTAAGLDSASFYAVRFTNPPGPSALAGTPAMARSTPTNTQSGSANLTEALANAGLPLQSPFVRVRMNLVPSTDQGSAPSVQAWNQQVSCVPSE